MSGPRVLLVALDGTDDVLVRELVGTGDMPVLGAVLGRGRWGTLETARGISDVASWASFSTCRTVDHHGWGWVRSLDTGDYDLVRMHREDVEGMPFWQAVSDAGHTVTVLDVPSSPMGRGLRGVELVDWLSHLPDRLGAVRSDPPEFAASVVARYGGDHGPECTPGPDGDVAAFLADCEDRARRSTDLILERLAVGGSDLVIGVLGSGHCVGHGGWHLHTAAGADAPDPVSDHYRLLDRHLGEVIAAVDDDTTVIVFSLRGMSSQHGDTDLTDEVCHRLDASSPSRGRHQRRLTAWHRWVPLGVRRALPERWHRAARGHHARARASRTFFALDTGTFSGGVRVNLRGRESAGIVDPADLDALLDRLAASFLALVDRDSGAPAVDDVERVADRWTGPHVAALPDLFVHWVQPPPRAISSAEVGEIPAVGRGRVTGNHTVRGWLAAAGPGVETGPDLGGLDSCDLGPTVAALLGVDLPGADGRPIEALTGR